ncbi:MAG: hypothetical protein QN122_13600 [Armatimonadota bacterium]|nr:hypothetical protein [Armatimonadota bacterium]MDR7468267.1 hypothetical protein [Armatimonadota bacterium]MDR7492467.1 hypothetical protein [Armatimonadota bacterium]MDR7553861.1 hypothetical protein [Armatimonadota bacterium]MDR7558518.1 hypothetical protein [Armatimonadota bacterium]
MNPLAHALTGALIGQVAASPTLGFLGGLASHLVLDAIPHTEGETFRGSSATSVGVEHLEAAVELGLAVAGLWWVVTRCASAQPFALALGALGGIVPDLIDQPLRMLHRPLLLHRMEWHHTLPRHRAGAGMLTQLAAALLAGLGVWRLSGCGW